MVSIKKILTGGLLVLGFTMTSTTITGCLTDDKKDPVDTGKSTVWPAAVTVPAGAQGATLGSVLDIDMKKALSSAEANAAQETIDLVFMFYGSAFHLDNAVAAKAAGVANAINLTNTYDAAKIKDIKIVKISAKPKDQETAKTVFAAGTASPSNVIVGGEMFLVQTTADKLSLVTVGTIVGADNKANASFDLILTTI